jgi:hypothetical protein
MLLTAAGRFRSQLNEKLPGATLDARKRHAESAVGFKSCGQHVHRATSGHTQNSRHGNSRSLFGPGPISDKHFEMKEGAVMVTSRPSKSDANQRRPK